MRPAVVNVLVWIVGDFAQATGIEKTHHRRFGGKIVETGGMGKVGNRCRFQRFRYRSGRGRSRSCRPGSCRSASNTGNGCRARAPRARLRPTPHHRRARMQNGSAQAAPVVGPVRVQRHSPNLRSTNRFDHRTKSSRVAIPATTFNPHDKKRPLSPRRARVQPVPERDRGWLPPFLATVVAWGGGA